MTTLPATGYKTIPMRTTWTIEHVDAGRGIHKIDLGGGRSAMVEAFHDLLTLTLEGEEPVEINVVTEAVHVQANSWERENRMALAIGRTILGIPQQR